jgi:hypothetical protein
MALLVAEQRCSWKRLLISELDTGRSGFGFVAGDLLLGVLETDLEENHENTSLLKANAAKKRKHEKIRRLS